MEIGDRRGCRGGRLRRFSVKLGVVENFVWICFEIFVNGGRSLLFIRLIKSEYVEIICIATFMRTEG